ncbi:MAG: hypothetical protein M3547_12310 [Acidobacteriota bacterium]|nr:hypothetical protein [Acidobacteriota bacterium]
MFLRPGERDPVLARGVGSQAAANLRFIREAIENTGAFTAVSGWGQVVIGATALVAAAAAASQSSRERWLATWLLEAALAVTIAAVAMAVKARRRNLPLFSGPSRRFWPSFAAPLAVGAVLTAALVSRGEYEVLPGVWLLLFGAAVVAGGAVSVPLVRGMGWSFLALGVPALLAPAWGDAFLAAGFGGLLAIFGVAIARRHGG